MAIHTKSIIFLAFLLAISICITGCNGRDSEETAGTSYTPRQIARVMMASQDSLAELHPLFPADSYFATYLSEIYTVDEEKISDGVIYYTAGMLADEFAVLRLAQEAEPDEVKPVLEDYIRRRIAAFTGYAPLQAAILENGKVAVQGNYIALIICEDVEKAEEAFAACFSDNPPEVPSELPNTSNSTDNTNNNISSTPGVTGTPAQSSPNPTETPELTPTPDPGATQELPPSATPNPTPSPTATPDVRADVYDSDAILAVWNGTDTSLLTPKNKAIYDTCRDVIGRLITDDMDDYRKELAIHDWITAHASYDTEANSNAPDASPDPDNDNPYGLLIYKKAICAGYTLTFQLFMDMLGIECITVRGTALDNAEHAWNMVRIDGEWYCVDVTWNDPTSGIGGHRFFNVTSQFMRDTAHYWDESAYPEATADKLYY